MKKWYFFSSKGLVEINTTVVSCACNSIYCLHYCIMKEGEKKETLDRKIEHQGIAGTICYTISFDLIIF